MHELPVKLVGNGAGYGYGIMGPTHHALEDIGALRALPNLRLYIPLLATDVAQAVDAMAEDPRPNYLRLGVSTHILGDVPAFAPWRRLKRGRSCVAIGVGPILQHLYQVGVPELLEELEIWSVGTFPLERIPDELSSSFSVRERCRLLR